MQKNFLIKRLNMIAVRAIMVIVLTGLATTTNVWGQSSETPERQRFAEENRLTETPRFAVRTNMLHNLSTSPNLGVEYRLARRWTLELPFTINPWTYNEEKNQKFKFILIQPELRLWTCEAFNGHFFGLHGHYALFNVSALPHPPFSMNMNQRRYEGYLYGAGLSYGFQTILGARWGLEFEIGAGYARIHYEKYPCQHCARRIGEERVRNYWGLTRLGVSLIYFIF